MAANITVIRASVRKDLHDEDSSAYRWTDAVLDRHIGRAVNEYAIAQPLEQKTTLTATPGSRDISIASLTNLITLDAIEYPTLQFPPSRVGFSQWGLIVTLDIVGAPTAADNVFFFWSKMHTLDGSSSSILPMHDELIAEGAAGYAALDWTSYATNRVNVGGSDAWGRYSAFANERLRQFRADLTRLGRNNAVRSRRMFSSDTPTTFEQGRLKY